MTKNFNSNTDNNDEWLTPPYIIKELGESAAAGAMAGGAIGGGIFGPI